MTSSITITLEREDAQAVLESLKWSLKMFREVRLADPATSKLQESSSFPIYQRTEHLVTAFTQALSDQHQTTR